MDDKQLEEFNNLKDNGWIKKYSEVISYKEFMSKFELLINKFIEQAKQEERDRIINEIENCIPKGMGTLKIYKSIFLGGIIQDIKDKLQELKN